HDTSSSSHQRMTPGSLSHRCSIGRSSSTRRRNVMSTDRGLHGGRPCGAAHATMLPVVDGGTAHEAFGRREWQSAYDAFQACEELGADDQDAVGECAHWLGLADEAVAAYTEA